jgi:hypothetical protein
MLSVPYLAGVFGGLLTARAAPIPAVELAPLWGFACGVVTGCALGLLAAFAGGPLGSGRLTAVGPSGWQTGVVCVLEVGVAAAVTTGLVNWVRMRRLVPAGADLPVVPPAGTGDDADERHHIYVDPWRDAEDAADSRPDPPGPASLP